MEDGNYNFDLEYSGNDEIGTLTRSFKELASHVKDHITDLNKRVYVDALTSVRNKGAFSTAVEDLQTQMDAKQAQQFAIGVFDCDDLKSINDKYGHDKGDLYLKNACRLICRIFQHSPVYRIGGDEFAVILKGDDFLNRAELVRRFEEEARESSASAANKWDEVHVAVGIAEYDPQNDGAVIDTVRRADKIMYANKRARKDASC